MSTSNATVRPAGASDMFLTVKGAAHGVINGESTDDKHKGEIEVLSWSWGIQGKASLGGGAASGKATIREMKVVKKAATKAREGVNPFTGEKMMFKAKPASKKVRVMPLKSLKGMVNS